MDIQTSVQQMIQEHALFSPNDCIVVGVSGGADSLCLLHVLAHLPNSFLPRIHVAHLNHSLRAEADSDADFVQDVAAAWNLPCTMKRVDVRNLAQRGQLSLEEAGRFARYAFFSEVAFATGAVAVAVAHNADDQAETILMHFLRGSGITGLRGMLPNSPFPLPTQQQNPPFRLIRPLLGTTRAEIQAYCTEHALHPRVDLSNADVKFLRNRIRHELFPVLEFYNPSVRAALRRSAQLLADEYFALQNELERQWPSLLKNLASGRGTFWLAPWRALPTALQRNALREAIRLVRPNLHDIGFEHIEQARLLLSKERGNVGARLSLPGRLTMLVSYDTFVITNHDEVNTDDIDFLPQLTTNSLSVAIPGRTPLPGTRWTLVTEVCFADQLPPRWDGNENRWVAFFDADVIGEQLALRTRRPDDSFQPLGLGGHHSRVKDFMINQKLPAPLRKQWPLLVNSAGIVWIAGVRVDERARVRPDTTRVLCVRMEFDSSEDADESANFLGA